MMQRRRRINMAGMAPLAIVLVGCFSVAAAGGAVVVGAHLLKQPTYQAAPTAKPCPVNFVPLGSDFSCVPKPPAPTPRPVPVVVHQVTEHATVSITVPATQYFRANTTTRTQASVTPWGTTLAQCEAGVSSARQQVLNQLHFAAPFIVSVTVWCTSP